MINIHSSWTATVLVGILAGAAGTYTILKTEINALTTLPKGFPDYAITRTYANILLVFAGIDLIHQ
jgi:hypothetical protein